MSRRRSCNFLLLIQCTIPAFLLRPSEARSRGYLAPKLLTAHTSAAGRTAGPSGGSLFLCASFATSPASNPLSGPPVGPLLPPDAILIRYAYDGAPISHGRLCLLKNKSDAVTVNEVLDTLRDDGVDLGRFFAAAYETDVSGGGWSPLLQCDGDGGMVSCREEDHDEEDAGEDGGDGGIFELPHHPPGTDGGPARPCRIDIRLFRRDIDPVDATLLDAVSQKTGKLPRNLGYFGIGVVYPKTEPNVGTLWRSAYQLGASFLLTVGARYRKEHADTVRAITRIPLFELDDWSDFAAWSPRGARWVAIEMGGVPLEHFDHPTNAVYLLGSEDAGLPKSVLQACHEVVSLDCIRYASYNVAVAGSIVLYDRMAKQRRDSSAKQAET